jgi:hypothetical protein
MPWHNLALVMAGLIGAAVAIMHGMLIQRLMVKPLSQRASAAPTVSPVVRRLISPLLHFSTAVWFAGGIALVLATSLNAQARLCVGVLVGMTYLFGAAGNLWATRTWHPGWMLMTLALMLIAFGATAPSLQT